MPRTSITNAMSVDVEDYYQVSAFEPVIPRDDWKKWPSRVEANTNRILDLFAEHGVKATFFTLGYVAERFPALIHRIVNEGHELASHGMSHIRVTDQTQHEFRQDIDRSKKLLEDTGNTSVIGYRAASYSINKTNLWAQTELQHAGYKYSSSIYPVKHDLYGIPDAPRWAYRPEHAPELLEIPITTANRFDRNLPVGGGGYFRLMPYRLYRSLLNGVNVQEQQSAVFYFHPWEVDPQQPRPDGMSLKTRFRHYLNLNRMHDRLARLCQDFHWDRMDRVFLTREQ